MTPSLHFHRTSRYLRFIAGDAAIGNHDRAARHATTAVAVHSHLLTGARCHLQSALNDLAQQDKITYSWTGILR